MTDNQMHPEIYISHACELELAKHGDNFRGAGYTRSAGEAANQYRMMLELIREKQGPVSLLDLGCGLGHLHDFLGREAGYAHIAYTGLDISDRYIAMASARSPGTEFRHGNLMESDAGLPMYDYVIMNGLFNYRGAISREDMVRYWRRMVSVAWSHAARGIAFNVMSTIVDWERDDLFHVPFDEVASFVARDLSRHFVIRHDYGTYEFTTYVYRQPVSGA